MVRVVKQKLDKYAITVMIFTGMIFYLVPGQWISIEDDSALYLEGGGEGVLPGYPAFLNLFRVILGEQHFLDGVVAAQSILAVICTLLFVIMLRKKFMLQGWECILMYLACMLPFSIYLPESGITHQIMTEGLAYPLFYLYFLFLLYFVMDRKYIWCIGTVAMSFILMMIRRQLMILFLSTFAAFVYVMIRRIEVKKTAVKAACLCMGLLAVGTGLFIAALRTQKIDISQFSSVLMIRGFYEVDHEDKELFDTPEMQEIFERVYNAVDEKQYRYIYARQDLYMWKDLLCDRITTSAYAEIHGYMEEHPEMNLNDRRIVQDLGGRVLFKHFGRYLYHTLRLMIPGFIAAVFFQVERFYLLCHFIALFLYLYALFGSVICLKYKTDSKVPEFMLTVLAFILIMIVTVNLLFSGLQRYVVYAMGIFYCAAYLLFKELVMLYIVKRGNLKE